MGTEEREKRGCLQAAKKETTVCSLLSKHQTLGFGGFLISAQRLLPTWHPSGVCRG